MVGPFCLFYKERDSFLGRVFSSNSFNSVRSGIGVIPSNDFMRRAADVHPIIPDLLFRGRHARFRQP